jgi:tripartite-type tricarboxylate transporter receptor subunit TctC
MGWYVVMAPAAVPRHIVDRLSKELSAIMAEPEMNERLRAQGVEVLIGGPPVVARILQDEIDRSGKLIRELNLRLD